MLLGRLYSPTGKALETAQQVLEVAKPMVVNPATGCSNRCLYCYGDTSQRHRWGNETGVRLSKYRSPEIRSAARIPQGVFLSFTTDPFIPEIAGESQRWILWLTEELKVRTASLSKIGIPHLTEAMKPYLRIGMTICSPDEAFREKYEPNAMPVKRRIQYLRNAHELGFYTWVSMEPYPVPELWFQNLYDFIDAIDFADLIVFGKWNYHPLTGTLQARDFYARTVEEFESYCQSLKIRHWVKRDTLRFIGKEKKNEIDGF